MTPEEDINSNTEPDKPFRFTINPVVQEGNARRLVDIMAQCFPESGGICEDLRRKFEEVTSLKRQTFYDTLAYCKYRQWITGGAKDRREKYQLYSLNPNGSWREPTSTGESVGEPLSRDQLEYLKESQAQRIGELEGKIECLRSWGSSSDADETGVAIPSLIKIITDGGSTTRQRLKAAETILSYRVEDASVVEFTKKFLQSICTGADVATDHRVEAAGLLRRCESPRIAPETIKAAYREVEPAEPPIPLLELVRQRRERADRMQEEMIREFGYVDNSTRRKRSDEPSES